MNACQMVDWVLANRYAPTPLDHSPAAVSLDTLHLDMPAMVRSNKTESVEMEHLRVGK